MTRSAAARGALVAMPVVAALGLLAGTRHIEGVVAREDLASVAAPAERPRRPDPVERRVRAGETLSQTFADLGVGPEEGRQAVEALAGYIDPRRVRAGDAYSVAYEADGRSLRSVTFRLGDRGEVRLARAAGNAWSTRFRPFARELRPRRVEGRLDGSLEDAVRAAGAEATLAYEMADVLQWDLDFNRDLRIGDRFVAVVEETWLEGERHGAARIVALAYENEGRRHEAFRYGDGYFDREGRPLQKMFLRSPLKYSRVTSRFSVRRFHPVLKVHRPHWGVDYGAPVGTPVHVTASGTVLQAAWDGGGGKTVKVRHPNGYVSCYLHLSRFAEGVRPGARVRQGDVVGYVGSTGLATAPHLDYRVQATGGRWIDPLRITNVPAEPLGAAQLALFQPWRERALQALDRGEGIDEVVLTSRLAGDRPAAGLPGTVLAEAGPSAASAGDAAALADARR